MLAMLRSWGWPARYVCGYQFSTDDAEAGRIDASAMHAWVEVYCHCGNWIGLDATTGAFVDERYVAVGHGRDYDDVRPIRGVLAGSPIQTQESHLSIVRSNQ